jgi:amino acid permease
MFKEKQVEGTASAASAIINLSKTILGASMLALPNAFQVGASPSLFESLAIVLAWPVPHPSCQP